MHVLVTGGAGYLGCEIVKLLIQDGLYVTVIDASKKNLSSIRSLGEISKLRLVELDVTDKRQVSDLLRSRHQLYPIDSVVHMAAVVGRSACAADPEYARLINVNATVELFESAMANSSIKRYVFCSTCAVYGNADRVYFKEDAILNPNDFYSETKAEAERRILASDSEWRSIILRLPTIFGQSHRMRYDLMVNKMVYDALVSGRVSVQDGDCWRPFLHCRDVARTVAWFATGSVMFRDRIFNVGVREMHATIRTAARYVSGICGECHIVEHFGSNDGGGYRIDCRRLRRLLGLGDYVRWTDGIQEVKAVLESKTCK
jgi:nucleoside-diphosphate-sugar epimerase